MLLQNGRVRGVGIHLQVDKLPHALPQADHTLNSLNGSSVKLGLDHAAVFTVVHFTVHQGVGEVLYIGVSRDGSVDGFTVTQIGQLGFLVCAGNMLDSLF